MSLILLKDIFFMLLFCYSSNVSAQFLDSILVSFKSKPTLDVRLDTRNSFITHLYAKITGVKAGLKYNDKVMVGIGYNWLRSNLVRNAGTEWINGQPYAIREKLTFAYISPYIEYTFYQSKNWEISIPVLFGLGWMNRKRSTDVNTTKTAYSFVTLYEPYMTAEYKILKYFAIGFGSGYRLILKGDPQIRKDLTSPIYILKANILVGEIYRKVRKNRDGSN